MNRIQLYYGRRGWWIGDGTWFYAGDHFKEGRLGPFSTARSALDWWFLYLRGQP